MNSTHWAWLWQPPAAEYILLGQGRFSHLALHNRYARRFTAVLTFRNMPPQDDPVAWTISASVTPAVALERFWGRLPLSAARDWLLVRPRDWDFGPELAHAPALRRLVAQVLRGEPI